MNADFTIGTPEYVRVSMEEISQAMRQLVESNPIFQGLPDVSHLRRYEVKKLDVLPEETREGCDPLKYRVKGWSPGIYVDFVVFGEMDQGAPDWGYGWTVLKVRVKVGGRFLKFFENLAPDQSFFRIELTGDEIATLRRPGAIWRAIQQDLNDWNGPRTEATQKYVVSRGEAQMRCAEIAAEKAAVILENIQEDE